MKSIKLQIYITVVLLTFLWFCKGLQKFPKQSKYAKFIKMSDFIGNFANFGKKYIQKHTKKF